MCFDATVLCGALRKPTGLNFRLLEIAAQGGVYEGFTTDVAGLDFVRNAVEGLGGVIYDNGTWLVNGDPCSDDLTAGRLVAMCLGALAHATANTEGRWLQPSRGEDA